MKTMRTIFTITLLPVFLLSLQCCDDSPTELEKLPPATQSGKNTFGCLVNGKAWVTEISTDADAYYQAGVLSITAGLTNYSLDQGINIGLIDGNLIEKEYILTEYPQIFGRLRDHIKNCEFPTSIGHTGKLTITHFDQVNFIISGTFEFEGYSSTCNSIVKVTHGRFDLNYTP